MANADALARAPRDRSRPAAARRRHASDRDPADRGVADRLLGIADVSAGDRRRGRHSPREPVSPLRVQRSDPRRAGPALPGRPESHRARTAQARLDKPDDAARLRQDRRIGIGDRQLRGGSIGAALQMSFYEGPSADPQLIGLTRQPPTAIQEAMLQTLRAGRWSGYIKPDIDLPTLADRICQTMMQVGLDVMRHNCPGRPGGRAAVPDHVAGVGQLSRRPMPRWTGPTLSRPPSDGHQDLGRRQRGRRQRQGRACPRGCASGVRPQGLRGHHDPGHRGRGRAGHRHGLSGDRIQGRTARLDHAVVRAESRGGWVSVLRSDATPVEKLDALSWVNINALDQFSDEFRIQLAWMRQSPPTANPGWSYHYPACGR